ncbi:MAG: hypothetical protein Q7K33_02550 [Candidatus Berkelbacteria bacterium]|nr:hypothetical protein [Candidatus Berkelbacteria bacterium]
MEHTRILQLTVAFTLIHADVCKGVSSNGGGAVTERQRKTLLLAIAMIADALEINEDSVASEWGVSRSTWRRWQRGAQYPSVQTLLGNEKSLIRLIERKTWLTRDDLKGTAIDLLELIRKLEATSEFMRRPRIRGTEGMCH